MLGWWYGISWDFGVWGFLVACGFLELPICCFGFVLSGYCLLVLGNFEAAFVWFVLIVNFGLDWVFGVGTSQNFCRIWRFLGFLG